METQLLDITALTTDPANVRRHGERNLEAIKGSLKRFGQQKPIVVGAKGVVIAGNGTLEAARALGWKKIAVVRSKLKGAEGTAYSIADNRTAELAEWDDEPLAEVLAALQKDESIDELVTGFDAEEIEALVGRFIVDESGMPVLANGDRAPFQQMTFTLHDDQVESVKRALTKAKQSGSFADSENENSNGNALARIVEAYLGAG